MISEQFDDRKIRANNFRPIKTDFHNRIKKFRAGHIFGGGQGLESTNLFVIALMHLIIMQNKYYSVYMRCNSPNL